MKHLNIILFLFFIGPFVWAQDCTSGDCENGYGTKKWETVTYIGDFKDGYMHGNGKFVFENGGSYEGEFREDFFEGKGIRIYQDGARYEGQFKYNKFHGKGKRTYLDGNIYEGEWQFGYKHEQGKTLNDDGYSYTGEYKFGDSNGKGKQQWKNGDVYEGTFKDGYRDGYGEYSWPNGEVYKGSWKQGVKQGIGTTFNNNGTVIQKGLWHEGEYKSNKIGCLENGNLCLENHLCCIIKNKNREVYYVNGVKYTLDKKQITLFLLNYPTAKKRYFYNDKWNLTSEEDATYYREIFDYDSNTKTYEIRDYYKTTNYLQFKGRSLNNNPSASDNLTMCFEGKTTWYNEDGSLSSETNYLEGRQHGKSIIYLQNGETFVMNYDRGNYIKDE